MIHLMSGVGAPGHRHLRRHVVMPGVSPLAVAAQLPRAGAEAGAAHPVAIPERGGQIASWQRDLVWAENWPSIWFRNMSWATHLYHCSDPAPWWSGHPPACWCPPPRRWRWHSWLTSTGRSSAPPPPTPQGLAPPWCWPPCLQPESAAAEAAPQTGLWPAEADSLSCCCCVVVSRLLLLCRDLGAVVKMSVRCWGRVCCSLLVRIRCFDIVAVLVVSMLNSMLRCCWLSPHCCFDCPFLHHSQYLHRQYPDNWQAWVQSPKF